MNSKSTGVVRLVHAAKYSLRGLCAAWRSEAAIRQEVFLSLVLIPIAVFSGKSKIEIILLLSGIFAVFITELLNTAIEYAIDRIGHEYHNYSKASKDIASAAVFLSLCYCVMVWGIIFLL